MKSSISAILLHLSLRVVLSEPEIFASAEDSGIAAGSVLLNGSGWCAQPRMRPRKRKVIDFMLAHIGDNKHVEFDYIGNAMICGGQVIPCQGVPAAMGISIL